MIHRPARPAYMTGGQPGGEANRMIVDAGQQGIRCDEGHAGVGSRSWPLPRQDRGERLAGYRADQGAPAPVARGWPEGEVASGRQSEESGEPAGRVASEASVEIVVRVHWCRPFPGCGEMLLSCGQ